MGIIDKIKTLTNRRVQKSLIVQSVQNVTPNMRRVTFRLESQSSIPNNSEGCYIKLMFTVAEQQKPVMRTYTISKQRFLDNEIDVDFMLHVGSNGQTLGVAAPWSINAEIGEAISFFGPGPASFINPDADFFLLGADMTALPALAANLKRLSVDAHGKAFIEILSDADKQDLTKPQNIDIVWIINDKPGSDESPLYQAIKENDDVKNKISTWVACEFKTMKKIRQYLKIDLNINKTNLYISSYWKQGNTEEQHKIAKQDDAKALNMGD